MKEKHLRTLLELLECLDSRGGDECLGSATGPLFVRYADARTAIRAALADLEITDPDPDPENLEAYEGSPDCFAEIRVGLGANAEAWARKEWARKLAKKAQGNP